MRNVAALRAEHLVRQILRLFLGAPRRRRPPSKTEVRPRSRHPRRHPLSTGHRRGAPTAASCVKARSYGRRLRRRSHRRLRRRRPSAVLAISAVLAPLSLAVLRVTTSLRPAATSDTKGTSVVGVSCRASMTTTTGAATVIPITRRPLAAIRPRTTSRRRGAAHHECQDEKVESMMMRFAMATAAVLLGCGSAYAQARLNVSPLPALGMTSPLGIPNAPVGHTGIPLGATELATPGVSPTTSGAAPLIGAPCAGASSAPAAMGSPTTAAGLGSPMTGASAGMGGSTTGASGGMGSSVPGLSSTALFDGGGMSATAPTTCAASATASPPLASSMGPGSTVGPAGIPLGSTEVGGGGLSPPSVALNPNLSAPVMSLLPPLSGMTPPSTPSVSAAPSTPTCAATQTGVPTIAGVPTTFGAPLAGRALGAEATRCR